MKRSITLFLLVALALAAPVWSVDGSKAEYVGGTLNSIKQGTDGVSSTMDEKVYTFKYKKGELDIPYDQINSLEYGQKAGRRVGLAIAISPIALLSKKRKHFLTVGFVDKDEKQQAVVLELGKDIVRITLATIQARTGRKIEYQDEEARQNGGGN